MKKNCAYDVVIAGGALTGLSMAALLADTNVNVALVAPSAPPVRDRRTTAVAAGPQTLLNACGVWKKINHAEPIRHIRVLDIGRPQPLNFYAHHHAPFGWIIDNADLLGALKERVREAKNISMIDDVVTRVEADAHFSSIATQRHGHRRDALREVARDPAQEVRKERLAQCEIDDGTRERGLGLLAHRARNLRGGRGGLVLR
ncbi:MAG: hypothetical protein EBZ69_10085 [Alphaproteobacteria bacterium]|nr:hypothetical protein [Alphaproteobacteria bacterium]